MLRAVVLFTVNVSAWANSDPVACVADVTWPKPVPGANIIGITDPVIPDPPAATAGSLEPENTNTKLSSSVPPPSPKFASGLVKTIEPVPAA